MADPHPTIEPPRPAAASPYVVVARRYRPQSFGELIGQEHVAQALSNAITSHRVGHAYLFTGARGVGKTSCARILAKALDCVAGPTATPCNRCDICRSISLGDDVDVLEIDGASNRGIDEIRQLRQNVNVRPSRARFKIYIIDEVHMLTREAFNALLKTLEEPPEHVKFIFCTTEPAKIPITILSRCQRFDFAGISPRSIAARLSQIVAAEGVEAEPEALEIIARRAAGSMRDSQSLLEQLLSFASERITVADIHGMLGTAGDQRLSALVRHLVDRNPAGALAELDAAAHEGVEPSQLIEQLFGYLRDCMLAAVGCAAESFLYVSPAAGGEVAETGRRLGLHTILAAMQILDQTLSRMRLSTQARTLAELAVVRISQLEELDELADWIAALGAGQSGVQPRRGQETRAEQGPATAAVAPPSAAKKNIEAAAPAPELRPGGAVAAPLPLAADTAAEVWGRALERMSGLVVEQARQFSRVELAGPNRLAVYFSPKYTLARSACQRPDQASRFEQALAEVTGGPVRVEFLLAAEDGAGPEAAAPRPPSPHQRLLEVSRHPMLRRAAELFGAQPVHIEEPG
ncbi:MAG: DNA polymerase III subunit gamma/tau [Thermoguttaceae bacterium]|jgi:DNA polymerase-3 subunit gamma/tau